MSSLKRRNTILLLLWPASLLLAFFIGRLSLQLGSSDPSGLSSSESVEKASRAIGTDPVDRGAADAPIEDSPLPGESEIHPLDQMRQAIAETDALKRLALLADALSRMEAGDIEQALAIHDMLPESNAKRQMYNMLLNTWGKLDGPAAMEYVLANSDQDEGRGRGGRFGGGGGSRDAMSVMSGWAETDPQSAVLWAEENGVEERGRNAMMMAAVQGWANTDIRGALDFAIGRDGAEGNGRGPGGGIEGLLINRFVNDDKQAAAQWALSQYDPEVRSEAVSSVARSLAGDNPQEAVLWAQSLTDPASQAEALKGTVAGWVRESPVEAVEWAMNLDNPETSSEVVQSALNSWVRMDPYAAGEYVIGMETGETRNTAAATLSRGLSRQDPEMAALWAESITDPKLQAEAAQSVYNTWTQRRPEAAAEWVQSSNLPEETKQDILTPKKKE